MSMEGLLFHAAGPDQMWWGCHPVQVVLSLAVKTYLAHFKQILHLCRTLEISIPFENRFPS